MDLKEALKEKSAAELLEEFKTQIEKAELELKIEEEKKAEAKREEAKNNFILAAMDYLVAYGIVDENEENDEIVSYMCKYIESLEQSLSKYGKINNTLNKWIGKIVQ